MDLFRRFSLERLFRLAGMHVFLILRFSGLKKHNNNPCYSGRPVLYCHPDSVLYFPPILSFQEISAGKSPLITIESKFIAVFVTHVSGAESAHGALCLYQLKWLKMGSNHLFTEDKRYRSLVMKGYIAYMIKLKCNISDLSRNRYS
jgi:hypothetical protein